MGREILTQVIPQRNGVKQSEVILKQITENGEKLTCTCELFWEVFIAECHELLTMLIFFTIFLNYKCTLFIVMSTCDNFV